MKPIKRIVDTENLEAFQKMLESASIGSNEKNALEFAIEFLAGRHDAALASRSFLLKGEPGVGKTHIAESFVRIFKIPVLYAGCAHISHKKIIQCKNMKDVLRHMKDKGNFIVFLDDLNYLFKYSEYEAASAEDRQLFMKIVDRMKGSKSRAILFATANSINCLDESVLDRIDVKIEVDVPSEDNKTAFLCRSYSQFIDSRQIRFMAKNSLGYNFRDIPEVIKIAYRNSRGKIKMDGLKHAIKTYVPTSMQRYEVLSDIKINFSHIIGKERAKRELANVISAFRKKSAARKLGLVRHNLLVFDGPVGSGKTFMVKALAGELGMPILNIKGSHFFNYGAASVLNSLDSFQRRFSNCIIFVDEAEKLMGRNSMDEDSPIDGRLNQIFDGIGNVSNAIVIVAVNNLSKFGEGFSDRFTTVRFELPSFAERKEFCMRMLARARNFISDSFDFGEAARLTDGMSFRDIEKACNSVFYRILQGENKISIEMFHDAVKFAKPFDEAYGTYG